ncbi:DUF4405 domain-containing protein [Desulfobacula phenolica]|uniref:Flavinylation-associated cytochrome domain-containing protein n=1 Tax=Desulfobacula phenolica TaxID=90732 RepID=A0A1H2DMH1_9BACT|nr:DUF4405 domain-containing protein [Desulfobacula phenolica]SDT83976.1 protein of unknown function [Desulfobacula phenolica]
MSMRRIISLTAFLSFFVMLLTSVILYIVPQGRVAYWADWRLWTLSKDQWGAIHINAGFLLLLSIILHIYYNWKPIVLYLKNQAKQITIFTKEFNAALILTLILVVGTYVEIPPFSTIINISDGFKESAAKEYGEPPYGHAELSSIKTFSKKMNIDLKAGIKFLEEAGYKISQDTQTLKEIAKENNISPQQIYLIISRESNKESLFSGKTTTLPENPPPGTGNLTLADFCSQYNLNIKIITRSLKESNIVSKADMTIKKIGETNKISPTDIYEQIKLITSKNLEN